MLVLQQALAIVHANLFELNSKEKRLKFCFDTPLVNVLRALLWECLADCPYRHPSLINQLRGYHDVESLRSLHLKGLRQCFTLFRRKDFLFVNQHTFFLKQIPAFLLHVGPILWKCFEDLKKSRVVEWIMLLLNISSYCQAGFECKLLILRSLVTFWLYTCILNTSLSRILYRNNFMYKVFLYAQDTSGKETLLTPRELQSQLEKIMSDADAKDQSADKPAINPSVFTTANRTRWAQVRP